MEDKKFEDLGIYSEMISNRDRQKILAEYNEYAASAQRAAQFSTIHSVEFRNLATFLVIFSVSMFFSFDLNSTLLFWMIVMLISTIITKFAQIGSAIEMNRFRERLDNSVEAAARQKKDKDV